MEEVTPDRDLLASAIVLETLRIRVSDSRLSFCVSTSSCSEKNVAFCISIRLLFSEYV